MGFSKVITIPKIFMFLRDSFSSSSFLAVRYLVLQLTIRSQKLFLRCKIKSENLVNFEFIVQKSRVNKIENKFFENQLLGIASYRIENKKAVVFGKRDNCWRVNFYSIK